MENRWIQPSPYLNDQKGFFGLSIYDWLASILFFCLWSEFFKETQLEWVGFFATACLIITLIPIRLRFRKKIIRSYLYAWTSSRMIQHPFLKRKQKRVF